jgi:ABC-2 type transport system permease protein
MTAASQTMVLSRRALVGIVRQPSMWMPGFFFPFMLAAVYSAQFSRAVDLPAFPFDDITFLDFILPASVLQGVAFGSINGGSELALDLENGFIDRLLTSPVARPAILVGRLAGAMGYAIVLSSVLMVVFTLMGADIAGGVASVLVVLIVAALLSLAMGSIAAAIALRTGSQEVVQSIFPLVFVMIFTSSAFFPVSLMEGWYGALAAKNPITWIIDPTRRLTVVGFDAGDMFEAIGIAMALASLALLLAFTQLQRRLRVA